MTKRRARREYSEAQKKQLVELYNHGKQKSVIIGEYELSSSSLNR